MKLVCLVCSTVLPAVFCLGLSPSVAQAQGAAPQEPFIPLSLSVTGEMFWNIREETGSGKGLSQIPRRDFRLKLNPRIALWGVELKGKFLYSSLDDGAARARNRLFLTLERGPATLAFGDCYANSSQFVTHGVRTRGVGGTLKTDQVNVTLLHGESKRSTEGSFDVDGGRITKFGVYQRNLTSLSVDVAPTRGLTLSASLASGEDDRASILYGKSPRSNTAFGADIDYVMGKKQFSIGASVGSSETDILGTESNQGEEFNSNLAYEVRAGVRIKAHQVSANYYSKDTHYESFAAPTLTPDRKGFEVEDRFNLFNRRASVTAEFRSRENNVDGKAGLTLATTRPSLAVTLKAWKLFPRIQLAASRTISSNNAGDDDAKRVDHHLDEGRIRLEKDIKVRKAKVTPSVSFKQQRRFDQARPQREFTRMAVQFSTRISTRTYTPTLRTSFTETDFDQPGQVTVKRSTFSLSHRFQPTERIQINGKQAYTLEKAGASTTGKRTEFEAGVVYKLIPKKLNLTTTFKYFDFSSETRTQTNYDGFNIRMKVSTVGAMELVSRNP